MPTAGAEQSFFVVASTDLSSAEIMMARIREQLSNVRDLKTTGQLKVTAAAVPLPDPLAGTLEQRIAAVAHKVTEMTRLAMAAGQT